MITNIMYGPMFLVQFHQSVPKIDLKKILAIDSGAYSAVWTSSWVDQCKLWYIP